MTTETADPALKAKDRKAKRIILAACALSLAVAAGIVGGVWVSNHGGFRRNAAEQTRALLARNEPLLAYEAAAAGLQGRPDNEELKTLALEAADKQIEWLQRRQSKEAALNWLTEELAQKEFMQAFTGRQAELDTELNAAKAASGGRTAEDVMAAVRKLLAKHPQPEIPVIAAGIVKQRYPVEGCLWLYKLAFDRGYKATNLEIFDACGDVLERNAPQSDDAQFAHTLMRAHFPKERAAWADKALDKADGYEWLNAYAVIVELNIPKMKDPLYESLAKVLSGEEIDQYGKILLRLRKEERRRAAFIVSKSLESNVIRGEARDQVETLAQKLRTE
ncbi:MAG: hypothetical protein HY291_04815 [Planctomycetes bacterium]|nr:hypothetical protein [Planctomycetota bacterium]